MRKNIVRSLAAITLFAAAVASSGCASTSGGCPTVTTTSAELVAYGGTLAALKSGAPVSVITGIDSNIDNSVSTGQFDSTAIVTAIIKAGGQQYAPYFGAVEILFGTAWQSSVDSNLTAATCTLPVLENISAGIKLAVSVEGQPANTKLAPFQK